MLDPASITCLTRMLAEATPPNHARPPVASAPAPAGWWGWLASHSDPASALAALLAALIAAFGVYVAWRQLHAIKVQETEGNALTRKKEALDYSLWKNRGLQEPRRRFEKWSQFTTSSVYAKVRGAHLDPHFFREHRKEPYPDEIISEAVSPAPETTTPDTPLPTGVGKPTPWSDAMVIFSHLENAALGVRRGLVDDETLFDLFGGTAIGYYCFCKPFIEERRRRNGRAYNQLAWLMNEAEEPGPSGWLPWLRRRVGLTRTTRGWKERYMTRLPPVRLLVLTNHHTHGEKDSLFKLCETLHQRDTDLRIASTAQAEHAGFFYGHRDEVFAIPYHASFTFEQRHEFFERKGGRMRPEWFDAILLRIDQPTTDPERDMMKCLLPKLRRLEKSCLIINSPSSIERLSNKSSLIEFPEAGEVRVIDSVDQARALPPERQWVLKPTRSYGGKGIVRLEPDSGHIVADPVSRDEAIEHVANEIARGRPYVAVPFLSRIQTKGDTRVIVLCGEIVGAFRRVPAAGGYLANLGQGGHHASTELNEAERELVASVDKRIRDRDIWLYGLDLIDNDHEEPVLSEINVFNVGGFIQAAQVSKQYKDALTKTADLLINNIRLRQKSAGVES